MRPLRRLLHSLLIRHRALLMLSGEPDGCQYRAAAQVAAERRRDPFRDASLIVCRRRRGTKPSLAKGPQETKANSGGARSEFRLVRARARLRAESEMMTQA